MRSAQPLNYRLTAMVNHVPLPLLERNKQHVTSIDGGHYECIVRNDNGWLKFSDTVVKEYNINYLDLRQPYILFYEKFSVSHDQSVRPYSFERLNITNYRTLNSYISDKLWRRR